MKVGFRTPSPSKSFKTRTTGKINRTIKSSINPTYGKKGMGYLKDPKKAVYNKIYHKTTVSVNDFLRINGTTVAGVENNNISSGISEFHDKAGMRICPGCSSIYSGRLVCPDCDIYLLDYNTTVKNKKQRRNQYFAYMLIAALLLIVVCIIIIGGR